MTQFPIKAELSLKGLVRSTMLMSYLRVNAWFYGQRHVSSGLYTITRQQDIIDGNGYRTTLTLLRIAGDNDYIVRTKQQVTSNLPVMVMSKEVESPTNQEEESTISALATRAMNTVKNIWDTVTNPGELISNLSSSYNGGAFTDNDFSSGVYSSGGGGSHSFGSSQLSGNDTWQYIWTMLNAKIQNPIGTAGLMGNLYYESAGKGANSVEGSCISYYKKKGVIYTNESYTNAVDSNKLSRENFIHVGSEFGDNPYSEIYKHKGRHFGYGLVQWTDDARKGKLYDLAKSTGKSIGDITLQALYILQEISPGGARGTILQKLQSCNSIDTASDIVLDQYEQPSQDARNKSRQDRRNYSRDMYNLYSGKNYGTEN